VKNVRMTRDRYARVGYEENHVGHTGVTGRVDENCHFEGKSMGETRVDPGGGGDKRVTSLSDVSLCCLHQTWTRRVALLVRFGTEANDSRKRTSLPHTLVHVKGYAEIQKCTSSSMTMTSLVHARWGASYRSFSYINNLSYLISTLKPRNLQPNVKFRSY